MHPPPYRVGIEEIAVVGTLQPELLVAFHGVQVELEVLKAARVPAVIDPKPVESQVLELPVAIEHD